MQNIKVRNIKLLALLILVLSTLCLTMFAPITVNAEPATDNKPKFNVDDPKSSTPKYWCGEDNLKKSYNKVFMSIDIGCTHKGSAIMDATFAIIRFLSLGVGIIIVGSLVVAGIQYSASRGDPQKTALAITRIQATLIALVLFVFGFAILNYLIPSGFLK